LEEADLKACQKYANSKVNLIELNERKRSAKHEHPNSIIPESTELLTIKEIDALEAVVLKSRSLKQD